MSEKTRKKLIIIAIIIVICVGIHCIVEGFEERKQKQSGETNIFSDAVADFLTNQMEDSFFLLASFRQEGEQGNDFFSFVKNFVNGGLPVYSYVKEYGEEKSIEDDIMAEFFMQKEGRDEGQKNIEEENLDYGDDALHIEDGILAELQLENGRYKEQTAELPAEQKKAEGVHSNIAEETDRAEYERQMQKLQTELAVNTFIPAQYPSYAYDWEEQWGYKELLSNFYAVDATTSLKESYVDLDELLYRDLSVDKEVQGPQILIYHTHSQEAFADSVEGDESTTIVGAGERLTEILTEEYGFRVLHHKGKYDVENRDYAYSNSLPEIEKILEDNPSIEVVIDLHRDEMQEGKKLVIDLQGRPTARFMFFNGMSHIRDKGDISYLENPYIQENLTFSFQAQVTANQYYPGIARKIYLKAYRYNMHLCPKSMLIELGAQTNTVEEIMNACDPLAHIISIVLNGDV